MEISQMLEKAKLISEAMNEPSEEKNNNDTSLNTDNFEQALKIVKLMKVMGELNKINQEVNQEVLNEKNEIKALEEKKPPIADFDQDLQTPAIRTIKAAIPYLDFEYQKNIGIMVKVIELDNLIKSYKNTAEAMTTGRKEGWQKEMLLSMKKELDRKNQYYIDMLVRFMDIKDIIGKLELEEVNDGEKV